MNSQAIHTISYDRILYSLQAKKKNTVKGSKEAGGYFVYKIIPRSPYTNSEATSELSRTEIMELSWL